MKGGGKPMKMKGGPAKGAMPMKSGQSKAPMKADAMKRGNRFKS